MKKALLLLLSISTGPLLFGQNWELVGHWSLNNSAQDGSNYGNHGILKNVEFVTDRHGNLNSAAYFNGVDSYIEVDHSASLCVNTTATFSAWIKMSSYVPSRIVDKQTAGGHDGYSFDLNAEPSKEKAFRLVGGGVNCYSEATLELNEWYHVVAVYENGKVTTYINGQYSTEMSGNMTGLNTNTLSFLIGACHPNVSKPEKLIFHGSIDDVRLYKKSLSAEEVLQLYNTIETGIDKIDLTQTNIFPVPTSNQLNISTNLYSSFRIVNNMGQLVLSGNITDKTIVVSDLINGTYIVELTNGKDRLIKSFMVNK